MALDLSKLTENELLKLPMRSLPIQLKGSWVAEQVALLHGELARRGLKFKPRVYIGDEWFSPDGVPAIAVPFYLFHPALLSLEKKIMLETEGGKAAECLRLLRHECGHALVHAWRLTREPEWSALFGAVEADADNYYHVRPYSKRYVRHLKGWYAQSHPEEDFAETFAVWLTPHIDWRKRYDGWPALAKLEYVERLAARLKGQTPPVKSGPSSYQLRCIERKLETHYRLRRKMYAEDDIGYFDADLSRIFPGSPGGPSAATWISASRRVLTEAATHWTRDRKFTVSSLLTRLARRCRELKLAMPADPQQATLEFASYLTALAANHVFTKRFKSRR